MEDAPRHRAPADPGLTTAVGDYIKAIWRIGRDGTAATGDIARELGVTAPSVTGMLTRLRDQGLVSYRPYHGAALTAAGRREAMRLLRRHRLIETFMILELDFGWDEVHAEAERLEHVVSDDFTERLAAHLGDPKFDPHGDPIPRRDGTLPHGPEARLSEAEVGRAFMVHRVATQEAEALAHLGLLGIEPGAHLRVVGVEPGGAMLTVRPVDAGDDAAYSVSRDLASYVQGALEQS